MEAFITRFMISWLYSTNARRTMAEIRTVAGIWTTDEIRTVDKIRTMTEIRTVYETWMKAMIRTVTEI